MKRDPLIQSALAEWRSMTPRERFLEVAGTIALVALGVLFLLMLPGGGR